MEKLCLWSEVWCSSIHNLQENKKDSGEAPQKLNIIKENDNVIASPLEIANKLADTFCDTSSNNNYSDRFREHKHTIEQNVPSFGTNEQHYYNRTFIYSEFNHAIFNSKDSTPGHDKITYSMIRDLQINVKEHILKLFNQFFRDTFFPHQWKLAVIIPIPNPGKDHSNPINYRPISLTSCLCKVFERLINNRIIELIQINHSLINIQCEGRNHRSTVDRWPVLSPLVYSSRFFPRGFFPARSFPRRAFPSRSFPR